MKPEQIVNGECIIIVNYTAIINTENDIDCVDNSRVTAYAGADQYVRPWIVFCNEDDADDVPLPKLATKDYLSDDGSLSLDEFCSFGKAFAELTGWCGEIEIDPMNVGFDADMELTERVAEILSKSGYPTVAKHATNDRSCNDIPVEIWLAAIAWASKEKEGD